MTYDYYFIFIFYDYYFIGQGREPLPKMTGIRRKADQTRPEHFLEIQPYNLAGWGLIRKLSPCPRWQNSPICQENSVFGANGVGVTGVSGGMEAGPLWAKSLLA